MVSAKTAALASSLARSPEASAVWLSSPTSTGRSARALTPKKKKAFGASDAASSSLIEQERLRTELRQLQVEHATVLERLAGAQRMQEANDASLDEWRRAWRELWELESRQQQQQLAAVAAKAQAKAELLERARDEDARRHREEGKAAAQEAAHAEAREATRAAWGREQCLMEDLAACRQDLKAARLEASRAAIRAAEAEARAASAREEVEARWRPAHRAFMDEACGLEEKLARQKAEHEAARDTWSQLLSEDHQGTC